MVTGSSGFIGAHLSRELAAAGHDVHGVDQNPSDTTQHQSFDLRAEGVAERWVRRLKPDVVVHLAAQVGRLFGEDDVEHTISSNTLLTARVAQACSEHGARLVYASTSEVYGDQGDHEVYESGDVVLPHNLYGLTKYHGEQVSALYSDGLQVLRLSMPFGPGLPAGRGRAAIVNFLYNALHGLPITVHRGSTRCWCWVGDTVAGIRMIIEAGEVAQTPGEWAKGTGVYNVGRSDNEASMLEVARIACELAGSDCDGLIQMVDPPANQTVVKRLTTRKLRGLGWAPTVDLREGMERTLVMVREMEPPKVEAAA